MDTRPVLYSDVRDTLTAMGFETIRDDTTHYDPRTGQPVTTPTDYSHHRRQFDGLGVLCQGEHGISITAQSCYPVGDCEHRCGPSRLQMTVRPTKPGMFRDALEAAIIAAARLGVIDADAGLIDTTVQPTVKGCGCGGCA